jgi:hypothetical protein
MRKNRVLIEVAALSFAILFGAVRIGHANSGIAVFFEDGFPAADSAAPSRDDVAGLFAGARLISADEVHTVLSDASTRLVVLPYGSAYPESAWPDIFAFLRRGGNLLVLGGKPFTRAAYRDKAGWKLRAYSVRDTRELLIDQYQETPGSDGLEFHANPAVVLRLPRFQWQRAFSPVIDGAGTPLDARLDPLVWGTKDDRRVSAPAIQIDHVRNLFAGGRWIFLNAELPSDFYASDAAKQMLPGLAAAALHGAEEFVVRPSFPLYAHGEPIELHVSWSSTTQPQSDLTAVITISSDQSPLQKTVQTVTLPLSKPVSFPAPKSGGLYTISAELLEGNEIRAIYRSGFWIRDLDYLRSGPHLGVNPDYFELDGHPLAVVGTTYLGSDVQRLFFEYPNVYVWDADLAQISSAGLNMIRTGWWGGWDKICDEEGRPYERTLRTLEAFLMTVRRHRLPVQFGFFSLLPEAFGGKNGYLDPLAIRRQTNLVSSVAARFHDVQFLAWDLINEPSFSNHSWQNSPNGDSFELAEWNRWLSMRYPDRPALVDAWNIPSLAPEQTLPVPQEAEFTSHWRYSEQNPLKIYDFFEFAQEEFTNWVKGLREAIRATNSQQLITVGQDEGGFDDRLSPAFFGSQVDFSTSHSWRNNDSLLWDSLVAKQPGQPMLIQETGLEEELTLTQIARRSAESDAGLLERKIALSFIEGSGAIQWIWRAENQASIGALRADATEKPEATVMRDFARFAHDLQGSLRDPQPAPVAIITSQASQFSTIRILEVVAQRNAVRAAAYGANMPVSVVAENRIAKMGAPKLVILASAQALEESTWQALLVYAKAGGNLLVTGPVERDPHWRRVRRAASIGLEARLEPLTIHNAEMRVGDRTIQIQFNAEAQRWLEDLHFKEGQQVKEIPYGSGRVFWAPYPVEMAEGAESAAALYSAVFREIGLQTLFELKSPPVPGILIYPMILKDSVLYVVASETDQDRDLDLIDKTSGGELKIRLRSQRAAIILIRKTDGAITAKYGF